MTPSVDRRRRGRSTVRSSAGQRRARAAFLLLFPALLLGAQTNPPATNVPAGPATPVHATTDTTALDHRVIAYYFHTSYRCASCRQLEAYSHAAIAAAFAQELESGRLVWRRVNVEEKANEHFVEDYKLFTKSLVVVEESKGRQLRWKNLAKVWELLPSKDKFYRYVQDEVRGYLAETP